MLLPTIQMGEPVIMKIEVRILLLLLLLVFFRENFELYGFYSYRVFFFYQQRIFSHYLLFVECCPGFGVAESS